MNDVLRRSVVCLGVVGASFPLSAFAAPLLDGDLSAMSLRDAASTFLILLVLNVCSLLVIGAGRAWLAPRIGGAKSGRSDFPGEYAYNNPEGRAYAGTGVEEGDRIASWVPSYYPEGVSSQGGQRVRIPIDADSFQSWQSIARDGIKPTKRKEGRERR